MDLLATTHADSRTRLPQPSPVTRMRFLYSSEALRPRLGYEMHETWRANAVIAFPSSIRAESSPLSWNRPARSPRDERETISIRGIDRNLPRISSYFSFPYLFILYETVTELDKRQCVVTTVARRKKKPIECCFNRRRDFKNFQNRSLRPSVRFLLLVI